MATLDEFFARLPDRAFWRDLCPGLHIEELGAGEPRVTVDAQLLGEIRNALLTEGWFQIGPLAPPDVTELMARSLTHLWKLKIPLAFAWVFDEFWQVNGWYRPLLAAMLGDDFKQLPDLWGHYIDHTGPSSGWHPHRDRSESTILPNRLPKSLSVWLPVTDATPDNGCMYVLPTNLDDNYRVQNLEKYDVKRPQDVRALPAKAGEFLCWNQGILHWGGRTSARAKHARISLALEYQRAGEGPYNEPLLDPDRAPTFEYRLGLVAKQILQYDHMYSLPDAIGGLAERMRDRFPI